MKALLKRKGNFGLEDAKGRVKNYRLNESPSEKEGKFRHCRCVRHNVAASMKALLKRKGNPVSQGQDPAVLLPASMKALLKRKGNGADLQQIINSFKLPQ